MRRQSRSDGEEEKKVEAQLRSFGFLLSYYISPGVSRIFKFSSDHASEFFQKDVALDSPSGSSMF